MNNILNLIPHYGYLLVFVLLTIELMGVPFLPGEILIVYCGFLVFKGDLNFVLLTITAALGVSTGLTISYIIGSKLGTPFFEKYGPKIHLGPDKMEKVSGLLNKYGMTLIFFICFIPGLKHVIGYFSGTSSMTYKKYALGAYTGSIVWAITFVSIGDLLGNNWGTFHKYIIKYLIIGGTIIVLLLSIFYILKIFRKQIMDFIERTVVASLNIFHSLGRLRMVVLLAAIVCILLVDAFVNIVQGLLSNQFAPFNEITYYIVQKIFWDSRIFEPIFKAISLLELSYMYIIVTAICIAVVVLFKSKHKNIEIKYTIITLVGGFILEKVLLYVFNFLSMYMGIFSDIFAISCFRVIVIYGFLFYVVARIVDKKLFTKILLVFFILLVAMAGISQLFFNATLSEILAGYSLGGAWLALNIILLEIRKVRPDINKKR